MYSDSAAAQGGCPAEAKHFRMSFDRGKRLPYGSKGLKFATNLRLPRPAKKSN